MHNTLCSKALETIPTICITLRERARQRVRERARERERERENLHAHARECVCTISGITILSNTLCNKNDI